MALYGASVEYAAHVLVTLASAPAGSAPSASDLAEYQKLPVAYVRKLMTQLEKAGLVSGREGIRGGWSLAMPAEEMTLLAIAEAVESQARLFLCRNVRARCVMWSDDNPPSAAVAGICEIHAAMLAAEAASRRELSKRTLAEIVRGIRAKSSRDFEVRSQAWFMDRVGRRRQSHSSQEQP